MVMATRCPYLLLMVLWAVCVPVFTQDNDNPQPDRWRDLVLDQSTPEDALKVLGKPSRRIESVANASGERLLDLEWKPSESFELVQMQFTDGKLSSITLTRPNKPIAAYTVPKIYELNFDVKIGQSVRLAEASNSALHQEKVYPKSYPPRYTLVALADRSLVECEVLNDGAAQGAPDATREADDPPFPGNVNVIRLTTRQKQ
jgi:hypothetical protein